MKIDELIDEIDQELFEKKVDYAKGVLKSKLEKMASIARQIEELEDELELLESDYSEFCEQEIDDIEVPSNGCYLSTTSGSVLMSAQPIKWSYLTTGSH